MQEPVCDVTPDGTYIFELQRDDGSRAVVAVLPEDIDEVAGPASATPTPEEKQRRYSVARLIADSEFARQPEGADDDEDDE